MTVSRTPVGPSFRARFLAKEGVLGAIIKTPAAHSIEILGDLGFDFVMLDAEHSVYDRAALDLTLLATRAAGIAGIVRVADVAQILPALDMGATGVMVPHVYSGDIAKAVAAACRYRGGSRGFASTTRAGLYGKLGMAEHVALADATVTVIAMIEDPQALDEIDAIVSVGGIDGVFLGRGDLAVALGESAQDTPRLREVSEQIAAAARQAGKTICAMASSVKDAEWLRSIGVTALIHSSDHGFLRLAARQALSDYAGFRGAR